MPTLTPPRPALLAWGLLASALAWGLLASAPQCMDCKPCGTNADGSTRLCCVPSECPPRPGPPSGPGRLLETAPTRG